MEITRQTRRKQDCKLLTRKIGLCVRKVSLGFGTLGRETRAVTTLSPLTWGWGGSMLKRGQGAKSTNASVGQARKMTEGELKSGGCKSFKNSNSVVAYLTLPSQGHYLKGGGGGGGGSR